MSWQAYVDDQLMSTKMVTHAVICGHDGNIWAQSTGFSVSSKLLIKNIFDVNFNQNKSIWIKHFNEFFFKFEFFFM